MQPPDRTWVRPRDGRELIALLEAAARASIADPVMVRMVGDQAWISVGEATLRDLHDRFDLVEGNGKAATSQQPAARWALESLAHRKVQKVEVAALVALVRRLVSPRDQGFLLEDLSKNITSSFTVKRARVHDGSHTLLRIDLPKPERLPTLPSVGRAGEIFWSPFPDARVLHPYSWQHPCMMLLERQLADREQVVLISIARHPPSCSLLEIPRDAFLEPVLELQQIDVRAEYLSAPASPGPRIPLTLRAQRKERTGDGAHVADHATGLLVEGKAAVLSQAMGRLVASLRRDDLGAIRIAQALSQEPGGSAAWLVLPPAGRSLSTLFHLPFCTWLRHETDGSGYSLHVELHADLQPPKRLLELSGLHGLPSSVKHLVLIAGARPEHGRVFSFGTPRPLQDQFEVHLDPVPAPPEASQEIRLGEQKRWRHEMLQDAQKEITEELARHAERIEEEQLQDATENLQDARAYQEKLDAVLAELQLLAQHLPDDQNLTYALGSALDGLLQILSDALEPVRAKRKDLAPALDGTSRSVGSILEEQTEWVERSRNILETLSRKMTSAEEVLAEDERASENASKELEARLERLTGRLATFRTQTETAFGDVEAGRTRLQREIETLLQDVNRLKTTVADLERKRNELVQHRDQLEAQRTELNSEESEIQQEISTLQHVLVSMRADLQRLKKTHNQLRPQKSPLEQERQALSGEVHHLEQELDGLRSSITSYKAALDDLNPRRATAEADLRECKEEHARLDEQIKHLKRTLGHERNAIESKRKERDELMEKLPWYRRIFRRNR